MSGQGYYQNQRGESPPGGAGLADSFYNDPAGQQQNQQQYQQNQPYGQNPQGYSQGYSQGQGYQPQGDNYGGPEGSEGGADGERGFMGALAGGAAGAFGGAKIGGKATGHTKSSAVLGAIAGAFTGSKLQDKASDWKEERDERKEEEKRRREEEERRQHERPPRRSSRSRSRSSDRRGHDSAPRGGNYAGSFTGSSRDIKLDSHGDYNLRASCRRGDGSYQDSTISLNEILSNDQGSFRWFSRSSSGGGGSRSYTVQPGDTLRSIGANFGCSFEEIARNNGINNPDLIYPGQNLQIPGGGGNSGGGRGDFGQSARNVRLVDGGQRLEAELLRNGDWVSSSINLDERISNDNGTLRFV